MADYQLPSDGSVVVIDDNIKEAVPLMQFLSKNGIASVYYSGTRDEELPVKPLSKVRLVFTDIQLFGPASPRDYALRIIAILDKIISDKNGPYILAVWSKTDDINAETLKTEVLSFRNPPFKIINLKKSNFFESSEDYADRDSLLEFLDSNLKDLIRKDDTDKIRKVIMDFYKNEGNAKSPSPDALALISEKLSEEFKDLDAFQFFAAWENCVNSTSGKIVETFSSLHEQDEYWSVNLRSVLYRMACAEMGKQIKGAKNAEIINNVVNILNRIFSGELMNNAVNSCHMLETIDLCEQGNCYIIIKKINNKKCGIKSDSEDKLEFYIDDNKKGQSRKKNSVSNLGTDLKDSYEKECANGIVTSYLSEFADFNTKLCIDSSSSHSRYPGVVSKIYVRRFDKRELIKNYFNSPPLLEDSELDKIEFIELNVVPFCDHAQKKWITEKERLLPGLMIPEKYATDLKNGESFYQDLPILKIEGILYRCIFDFRLLKSKDFYEKKKLWFKIRSEILADILSKLSNHANRIGVSFIE